MTVVSEAIVVSRVAVLGPGGEQVADVGQRVADRGQLPIEDRAQAVAREHHVAEPVVAVHDRGGAGLGEVLAEPRVTSSMAGISRVALCSQRPVKRRTWRSR